MEGHMELVWTILLGISQNLISHWIEYLIGGAMATALASWMKKEESLSWPFTIFLGLVVVTCFTIIYSLSADWWKSYVVGAKTAEVQIKEWVDEPEFTITRAKADTSETFKFELKLPRDGMSITVSQLREEPTFITIALGIGEDSQTQEFFSKLKPSQAERIRTKMFLELLHLGVQYTTPDRPKMNVIIYDQIIFDKTLSKRSFLKSLFNLQTAAKAAIAVYRLEESMSLEARTQ
jgi:hypothetical protein